MDEEDIDIYEDLPSFEVKDSGANKELSEKCLKFEEEIMTLKTKLEKSEKSRTIMAENLSSLMKTAKTEISRKDKMIAQLRRELDNLTFRRGGHGVRKKPSDNREIRKESDKNTEKEKTFAPQIKKETTNAKTTGWSDLSEDENEDFGETYKPDNIAKTLFGERLKKRIMLEEAEEKAQKQKNGITLLEKLALVQENEDKRNKDANGLIKKNSSPAPFNGVTVKKEILKVSSVKEEIVIAPIKKENYDDSLNMSTIDNSKPHRIEEKKPCNRGDLEAKLLKKKHEALINLAHGIKKPEEDWYHREDTRPRGSNLRHDKSHYNFETLENYDHSRITSKYTDRHYKESTRYRDDTWRMRQFPETRSESIHRSRSTDRRYNEKYNDRNYIDRCNDYRDKYEKKRDDRRYKEDDNWYKCKKEVTTDLREKIENRGKDRNDYDNYIDQTLDKNYQRRASKSRSHEKSRSRSSGRSREKELERKPESRSKKSKSTERLISVNSAIAISEDPQRRSKNIKDSKTVGLESTDLDNKSAARETLSESVRNDETSEKISCDILENGTIPNKTEESEEKNGETISSSNVIVEKLDNEVVNPSEIPITVLENDTKEALITSTVPEIETELASRSCREEEIENIEKFIKDYRENENPWLSIANEESAERDKSNNSTASIVDALSMDIEELPVDKKSNNLIIDNPPDNSTLNTKDVTNEAVSLPPRTLVDDQNSKNKSEKSEVSEISESGTEKNTLDKVLGKQMKRRPRIPCIPIISRYSRKKPSILTDSGASNCIVKSESSQQNNTDEKASIENISTRRISTEKINPQPIENNPNKTDSHTAIDKLVENSNNFTDNNSAVSISSEIKNNLIDDSRVREDAKKCKIEKTDDSLSVAVSTEVDVAAPKLNNVQMELRETRSTLKPIVTSVSSNDGKLANRKRALPKEDDTESKLATSKCKILVTVRRRRRIQLEDSCTAMTLVPSAHSDAHWN